MSALLVPATVTVDFPAQGIEGAIVRVSEAAGRKLRVDPGLRHLTLIVSVRDAPTERLLSKIATVADAEWVAKPDGRWLTRTAAQRAEMETRDWQQSRAALTVGLEGVRRALREEPWDGRQLKAFEAEVKRIFQPSAEDMRRGMSLDGPRKKSPATRLAQELLATMDADVVARLKLGESIVFSDQPRGREQRLPEPGMEAVRAFKQRQATFAEVAAGMNLGRDPLFDDLLRAMPPSGWGRTTFRVQNSSGRLSASVYVEDGNGQQVTWSSATMDGGLPYSPASPLPPRLANAALTPIRVPERIQRYHRAFGRGIEFSSTEVNPFVGEFGPDAEVRGWVNDPVRHDPMSFGPTLAWQGLIQPIGGQTVAVLPDWLFVRSHAAALEDEFDVASLRNGLRTRSGFWFSIDRDVVLARPILATVTEAFQARRPELRSYLQAVDRADRVRLSDYAVALWRVPKDPGTLNPPLMTALDHYLSSCGTPVPQGAWVGAFLGSRGAGALEPLNQMERVELGRVSPSDAEFFGRILGTPPQDPVVRIAVIPKPSIGLEEHMKMASGLLSHVWTAKSGWDRRLWDSDARSGSPTPKLWLREAVSYEVRMYRAEGEPSLTTITEIGPRTGVRDADAARQFTQARRSPGG